MGKNSIFEVCGAWLEGPQGRAKEVSVIREPRVRLARGDRPPGLLHVSEGYPHGDSVIKL